MNPLHLSLSRASHALALMLLGLMAGFFWTYTINVSPALAQMDGAVYAQVQSSLNRHVRHALFFVAFFGPPVVCALALGLAASQRHRAWWRVLAGAALVYALGIIVFTREVNLPLNYRTEAWNPQALPLDWAQVRSDWNLANAWRTVCAFGCFALGLWSWGQRLKCYGNNSKL